jgi:DNA mismatch endonuclease (patch repair protein)
MRRVGAKDTSPELTVRRLLRAIGETGYRLHRTELPGKPDIAFIGRRLVIFVHGCFWHGHSCQRGARMPKTNQSYWANKIERNRLRDARNIAALYSMGWKALVIWECEISNQELLSTQLQCFLSGKTHSKFRRLRHP